MELTQDAYRYYPGVGLSQGQMTWSLTEQSTRCTHRSILSDRHPHRAEQRTLTEGGFSQNVRGQEGKPPPREQQVDMPTAH